MAITPIIVRDGNNAAQSMSALQDPSGYNSTTVSLDTGRATYRVAANFTPFKDAAVCLIRIQGSATKTVRIKRVAVGGVSTANAQSILQLLKTSALGAGGGTAVTPVATPLDSASPAATAVVKHYTTAAEATGAAIGGPIAMANLQTCVVTTPTLMTYPHAVLFPEIGTTIGQAIVLRGASQFLEVQNVTPTNLSAATVLCYAVEWEEDAS
jgi:hypothetical protein